MKKFGLFLMALLLVGNVSAQQSSKNKKVKQKEAKKQEQPVVAEESEALRQQRVAQVQERMVGPMHRFLIDWSGNWREEIKIWNQPNEEPLVSNAVRDGRLFAEGRFLTCNTIGQIGHNPLMAQTVYGFDNSKMKFVKVYYDNLGTSILVLEGTINNENTQIEFTGTTDDPITRRPIKIRQVLNMKDPMRVVLEVFMEQHEGKELKTMEIVSTKM